LSETVRNFDRLQLATELTQIAGLYMDIHAGGNSSPA
jgi:hypothetical protein